MDKRKVIRKIMPKPVRKLIIQPKYHKNLLNYASYVEYYFGRERAVVFIKEATKRVAMLQKMPDANPKNKYRKHTAQKTYRNIIIDKVVITYYVSSTRIVVMDILHSAMSPEKFAE